MGSSIGRKVGWHAFGVCGEWRRGIDWQEGCEGREGACRRQHQRSLIRPQRYPNVWPAGPAPEPKPFGHKMEVQQGNAQEAIDQHWQALCGHLEDELANVYQFDEHQRRRHAGRGNQIRYGWEPLVPKFREEVAPEDRAQASWQWLDCSLRSLAEVVWDGAL